MRSEISKILELTESVILTPANLLENIYLNNYEEIKFFKENDKIVCTMISKEENNLTYHYRYEFTMDNRLMLACADDGELNYELFNREVELSNSIDNFNNLSLKKIV
ncbi:hypothetical protein LCI01_15510 [Leuconostoc citreum]|nr:hypothetical protein CRI81_02885 [Leuconostoc citreum]GEK61915.1 hypothetical protein LCI01_15510 [Leuconostoc citreum]